MKSNKPSIWVVDSSKRLNFVNPIIESFDADWITDLACDARPDANSIDLAIVSDERAIAEIPATLQWLKAQNVPTLHISDGILEWRNIWENPIYKFMDTENPPLFQPLLAHKFACLGRSQKRWLEGLGNTGTCELVGMPRLDALFDDAKNFDIIDEIRQKEKLHIVVATAKTPGFTEKQLECVRQELEDLKEFFDNNDSINGKKVEVEWRLTAGMDEKIGTKSHVSDLSGFEFGEVIKKADMLITTPSTTLLEGMVLGIPVAAIDYTNSPAYVQSAWKITAKSQIKDTIESMCDPTPERVYHQQLLLADNLEAETPAMPRLIELMEKMIAIGAKCRKEKTKLEFPIQLLADEKQGLFVPTKEYSLEKLFPNVPFFIKRNEASLHAELGAAYRTIAWIKHSYDEELEWHRTQFTKWSKWLEEHLAYIEKEMKSANLPLFMRVAKKLKDKIAKD